MNSQKEEYYKRKLKREEETRMFRHDVQKHLYSLQILLKYNKYDQINKYIRKLSDEVSVLGGTIKTGDYFADEMINYYSSHYKGIKFQWEGH